MHFEQRPSSDYREDIHKATNTYRFCNDLRLENEGSIFPDKLLDERFLLAR